MANLGGVIVSEHIVITANVAPWFGPAPTRHPEFKPSLLCKTGAGFSREIPVFSCRPLLARN
jgi:hypothetical protein